MMNQHQVQDYIDGAPSTNPVPIEFAGWLPIFDFSGHCGSHPQFKHTANPPPGYRFTCSTPLGRTRPTLRRGIIAPLLNRAARIVHGLGS
jgi:hypothetical protein